jgi:phosphatidylglycerophosphate synthase
MRRVEGLKQLNKTVQKPGYKIKGNWMARNLTRDMALPVTWVFLHFPVNANQVTFFSLVIALLSCFSFSLGIPSMMFVGAVFLQLWYLLDHVDGQIARYKKESSITGVYFDYITHYVVHMGVFMGIGIGAARNTGSNTYLLAGIVSGVAIVFFMLTYDSMYKAFFAKIEKSGKISKRSDNIVEASIGKEKKPFLIFRMLFTIAHKLCEIHVLMNIITVLAVIGMFHVEIPWGAIILVYALLTLFLAIMKTTYFVVRKEPDRIFKDIFEVSDES